MDAHVGTSGWTYPSWTGPFYPPQVKGTQRLDWYVRTFDTVEVNATFYRLPTRVMAASWNRRLPGGFHLVLKGSRTVTHMKKLLPGGRALPAFLEVALTLRALRVVLWQLPPVLARDAARLDAFLATLPATVRHAVEFRHPSWWHPETEEVLRRHRAAFAAISHPSLPDALPVTADFLYLRFHGRGPHLYDYDYSEGELADWAARVRAAARDGAGTVYAFFNNDIQARAPRNAATFRDLLGDIPVSPTKSKGPPGRAGPSTS